MHDILQICSAPCDNPEDEKFNLANDTRDDQNDRINGQLIEILMRLQQFDAPCAAEKSKANSSLLDVCTILKPNLQLLGQNISDYVSSRLILIEFIFEIFSWRLKSVAVWIGNVTMYLIEKFQMMEKVEF